MGVDFSVTPKEGLIKLVEEKLKLRQKFFIVTPNPEILLASKKNKVLKNVLNNADISLPDGVGISMGFKLFGLPQVNRIPGRIFMENLFSLSDDKKLKVFLLGSTSQVIERSLEKMKALYPGAKVSGSSGPRLSVEGLPVTLSDKKVNLETVKKINEFKPDLLFIAFGCPKQELWWSIHEKELKVGGAMVVGGSLDYFSNSKKLPPTLISNLGFEWFWRLLIEKNHLSRVVSAVFVFPLVLLRERIFQR